jgi:hypothetical protein
MTISLHDFSIATFIPLLQNLSHILDRGAEKLEPSAMVAARLAPDMYPLANQVQFACHQAEDAVARLTGQEPPTHELPEETTEQLKRRIAATIAWLKGVPPDAFAGAEQRHIQRPLGDTRQLDMTGLQYLREFSLPNFYFHLVTTYAILRNLGVGLGKADYMQHIGYALRPRG